MAHFKNTFSSLEKFLIRLQELKVINDYNLDAVGKEDLCRIELQETCKQYADDINLVLNSTEQNFISTLKENVSENNSNKSCTKATRKTVQLQADFDEVQRRINAFVTRKKNEVDDSNVREFCSQSEAAENESAWENVFSCARVDAVYIPRSGTKSHVKVSKVQNRWGPQTQGQNEIFKRIKTEPGLETENASASVSFDAIHERLQNMESYLNIKLEESTKVNSFQTIFQRLKQLEGRILYLEGISPDYFHVPKHSGSSPKKSMQEKEKMYSAWTMDDIQKRMQVLRDSLKAKSTVKKETHA